MPSRNSNRVKTREDFRRVVDELTKSGVIEKVREIILFGEHKTSWEQAAALLDEMRRQMHFGREQILLQAICLAFFLLGQGKLDKDMCFLDYEDKREEEAS